MKTVVIFDVEGNPIVGLIPVDQVFTLTPITELKVLNAIPALVAAAKPTAVEKTSETLAFKLFGQTLDSKTLPRVTQRIATLNQMGERLETFAKDLKKKSTKGFLHDESLIVINRLIPEIREALIQYKGELKEKTFGEVLKERFIPQEIVNRILSGTFKLDQMDLIRFFYPQNASKHLSFSIAEMRSGYPQAIFKEVLTPGSELMIAVVCHAEFTNYLDRMKIDKGSKAVIDFRFHMVSPFSLKENFKARKTRPAYPSEPVQKFLATVNFAFIYPQWLMTGLIDFGPKDLAVELTNVNAQDLPDQIQGYEDICPDQPVHDNWIRDPANVKKMQASFGLAHSLQSILDDDDLKVHEVQRHLDAKSNDENSWKILLSPGDEKKFKPPKKMIKFPGGNNRVLSTGLDLVSEVKQQYGNALASSIFNLLTTVSRKEIQDHVANGLYNRLLGGQVDQSEHIHDLLEDSEHDSEVEDE